MKVEPINFKDLVEKEIDGFFTLYLIIEECQTGFVYVVGDWANGSLSDYLFSSFETCMYSGRRDAEELLSHIERTAIAKLNNSTMGDAPIHIWRVLDDE